MKKSLKKLGAITLAAAMLASAMPTGGEVAKAYTRGTYSYANDYTLGYEGGVVAYKDGKKVKNLQTAGVKVYEGEEDRPFKSENMQAWDTENLVLTQPVKYTTKDGVAHDVESMLTNFDFIADPAAIDNSEVDGKLYVYGTTEAFSYENGKRVGNKYANHSLTILSTTDMVNWTDEGFMDTQNLTNLPSDEEGKVKAGFTGGNTWAPSGLKIDGDGDGENEYYIFYTNGGATGYVMADTPLGPWKDPLNKELCGKSLPNCADCNTCFDPGVLADDKGNAYVYFGGLTRTSGRVVKVKFEEGSGEVVLDGDPVKLPTHAFFEDNEINQFNGKYYYSYCSDFAGQALTKAGSICVYVSSDPLNICFDPTQRPKGEELKAFTDDEGVYHHFLGTVLDNPSTIYGQSYNNHHHMQEFKGNTYIFYHSTVLDNSIHRVSNSYRNLHVDEITVNATTDEIKVTPSYEGAEQIENFNPYVDFNGKAKEINATTTSYSAGVCSRRSDSRVREGLSPMVLDEIDTGDWTKIQGVDFGTVGAKTIDVTVASETPDAAVEVFVDDPTNPGNFRGSVTVPYTADQDEFITVSADLTEKITGVHDVYFVFRGSDYDVASWKFSDGVTGVEQATPSPSPTPTAQPTAAPTATAAPTVTAAPAVDYSKTYKVGNFNYKLSSAGTAMVKSVDKKTAKSLTIPAAVKVEGKAYKVTAIGAGAFAGCKKLTGVTIGSNVKSIGAKAFNGCLALKKITVKSTVVKAVGKNALKGTAKKLVIKVPKKKLAEYKKTFKGKGQNKLYKVK